MVIILMGVSGSGKTTLGLKLAAVLGCPFYDADDYHPRANKEKMGKGVPLTDEDRLPWLETLAQKARIWESESDFSVLACSALKQKYRDFLSKDVPVCWVYLKGDKELIRRRIEGRVGHYAGQNLLESQLASLEEPKDAIVVDISGDADKAALDLAQKLKGFHVH